MSLIAHLPEIPLNKHASNGVGFPLCLSLMPF